VRPLPSRPAWLALRADAPVTMATLSVNLIPSHPHLHSTAKRSCQIVHPPSQATAYRFTKLELSDTRWSNSPRASDALAELHAQFLGRLPGELGVRE
jgi:hypothetical protein